MALTVFEFAGHASSEYGVYATLLPMVAAEERQEFLTAVGRAGYIRKVEGSEVFEPMDLSVDCVIQDISRLSAMVGWLQGYGELRLPNRTGGHYLASVTGQIDLARIIAARGDRRFTVVFKAQPFWYHDNVTDITIAPAAGSAYAITNPGTASSAPKIAITGTGSVVLTVAGGTGTQVVSLTDLDTGIVLDAELQDALDLNEAALLNDHMSGDFPTLPPGRFTIAWEKDATAETGSVTRIKITPRWRDR